MVSGFVTSPDDQSRICFDDARPIRIASKSLMSIKCLPRPSSVFDFQIDEVRLAERADLGFGLLLGFFLVRDLDVLEVAERLVGRQRQLCAGLVGALLSLFLLLGGRLAADGPERARREVDAQLL